MKIFKYLLILVIAVTISHLYSCEKEDTDPDTEEEEVPQFILMDTLAARGVIRIYGFGEDTYFIKFVSHVNEGGSSGRFYGLEMQTNDSSEIAIKENIDSTWFDFNNEWIISKYDGVSDFNLLDTVSTDDLNFTNNNNIIANMTVSGWSEFPTIYKGKDLISKRHFYVVVKTKNKLVWIKLELLNYSSLVIWEYGYSNFSDKIVIGIR